MHGEMPAMIPATNPMTYSRSTARCTSLRGPSASGCCHRTKARLERDVAPSSPWLVRHGDVAGRVRSAPGLGPPQRTLDGVAPTVVGAVGGHRAGLRARTAPRGTRSTRGHRPTAHTPSATPANVAAPSAVVSVVAGRDTGHAELVGLDLQQQVQDRRPAVDAQRGELGARVLSWRRPRRAPGRPWPRPRRGRCAPRPRPRVRPVMVPRA